MITPIFVLTIFMITLGPIRAVRGFFLMTKDQDTKVARALAIKGTLVATAVCLLVALVIRGTAAAWQVKSTNCGSPAASCCSQLRVTSWGSSTDRCRHRHHRRHTRT